MYICEVNVKLWLSTSIDDYIMLNTKRKLVILVN